MSYIAHPIRNSSVGGNYGAYPAPVGGVPSSSTETVTITSPEASFEWHVGDVVGVTFTFSRSNASEGAVWNTTSGTPYGAATLGAGTGSVSHTVTAAEVGTVTLLVQIAGPDGGEVSSVVSGTVSDNVAPVMTAFAIPYASDSRTVVFTTAPAATDNVAVTGYLVNESASAPDPDGEGWSETAPTQYVFTTDGAKTLYAWAKDAAGNVSTSRSDTVIVDTGATAPTITAFVIPATSSAYRIDITTFTVTDDVAPAYYLVERRLGVSAVTPDVDDARWTATKPTVYNSSQQGEITVDAWAKDAAGNISAAASDTCTITVATTVTRLSWAGGWLVGGMMAPNGDMLAKPDTYGVWWKAAADTEWTQLVTSASMPEGTLDGWDQYTARGAYEVVFDPQDHHTLWMNFLDKIYYSTDTGTTWVYANSPDYGHCESNDQYRMNGQKMAIDPANSDVVLVGTQLGGLYMTTDGGDNWTHVATVPAGSGGGVAGICFGTDVSAGRTQTIFCSVMGVGVYRSTNAGSTWSLLTGSPVGFSWAVYSSGIYWISSGAALYQYASGAWTRITPESIDSVQAFIVESTSRVLAIRGSGHLVVCTRSGSVWSTSGPGWNMHIADPTDIPWLQWSVPDNSSAWLSIGAFFADTQVPGRVWITAGCAVWYCDVPDPFTAVAELYEWNSLTLGIAQLVTTRIRAPEQGHVLIGNQDRPCFVVDDDPDTLPSAHGPVMDGRTRACWGLHVNPSNVVGLVANMNGGGYSSYSYDGGRTWTRFPGWPTGSDSNGGCIAVVDRQTFIVVPGSFNLAYALTAGTQLYITHDAGTSWSTPTLPSVPASGQTGFGHVYFANWQGITTDRVTPTTVYVHNWLTGVYRSTNSGDTWTRVCNTPLWTDAGYSMWNFKMDAVPGNEGHLLAVPGPIGVEGSEHPYDLPMMRSVDGGANWTEIPIYEAHCFGFGKHASGETYPTVIVVGWYQGQYGIWRSTDEFETIEFVDLWPANVFDTIKDISGDMLIYGRYFVGWQGMGACYIDTDDAETVVTHTIVATTGAHGYVDPGAARVVDGEDFTFDLTPATGFHLLTLTVDGTPVTVTEPPQTEYEFANVTADHTIAVTWRVDVDVEPPTVPGSLAASAVSDTVVRLTWDASIDDVAVTGYAIWVDGVRTYTTSNLTYDVDGLTAETEYDFQVSAYDAATNESDPCPVVSETTLEAGTTAVTVGTTAAVAIHNDAYNGQSWTFEDVPIGTAASDRVVVVTVANANGGANSLTGVSIGGSAATMAVADSTSRYASLWYLTVAAGTTADIVVTRTSGTFSLVGIQVDVLYGAAQTGPSSTATRAHAAGVPDPRTLLNVTTPAGGATVIGLEADTASAPGEWTNATGDVSSNTAEGNSMTCSCAHTVTQGTDVTVSVTGFSYAGFAAVSASWDPA